MVDFGKVHHFMPRPCKNRFIREIPPAIVYKPAGIPARTLTWVNLALDEFETIRLLDYQGLDQEATAKEMGISRSTVVRIYAAARKKIAQALTEGKAICIEGGPVKQANSSNLNQDEENGLVCYQGQRKQGRGRGNGRGQGAGRGRCNRE